MQFEWNRSQAKSPPTRPCPGEGGPYPGRVMTVSSDPPRLQEVLDALRLHRAEFEPFLVHTISVFGSVARGDAGPESDVDLLVEFERPIGLFAFVRLQMRLAEILDRRVDLVSRTALKPALRASILREAVRAA